MSFSGAGKVLKNFRFCMVDGPAEPGDLIIKDTEIRQVYANGVNDGMCEVTIHGYIARPSFEEAVALELMDQP